MLKKKESLLLLNEQKIDFDGSELVIADNSGPLALAGIMGGQSSAITTDTKEVFLESAFFAPEEIAGRARSFSLSTDSSHRFERGVDYQNTLKAMQRAANLIIKFCGGECSNAVDIQNTLPQRKKIHLRTKKINNILGIDINTKEVEDILSRLNLDFLKQDEHYEVNIP